MACSSDNLIAGACGVGSRAVAAVAARKMVDVGSDFIFCDF